MPEKRNKLENSVQYMSDWPPNRNLYKLTKASNKLCKMWIVYILIRLCEGTGWSGSILFTSANLYLFLFQVLYLYLFKNINFMNYIIFGLTIRHWRHILVKVFLMQVHIFHHSSVTTGCITLKLSTMLTNYLTYVNKQVR